MNRTLFTNARAFYAIIAGQFVSTIGSGMTRFGLSIWVLNETGDLGAYTVLLFFAVLPLGLGSLFAGPLVDRWNRRLTIIVGNAVASFSTLIIALLFLADALALWHLYIALTINGVANAFIIPALDASTPLLIEKEQLGRASGLIQMIQGLEIIVSPALAGLLLGTFGLGAIFVVDFVTFGASIIALTLSAIPQPIKDLVTDAKQNLWQEFVYGVRYIRERPAFLYLMAFVTMMMFIGPGFGYALVTPLVLSFASEEAAGLVLSSFGIGSLIAGVLLAAWGGPQRRMDGMLAAMALAGVASIIVGLRENVVTVAVGIALIGVSFIFMIGLNRVIWQVKAAPEVLGRIFSLRVAIGVGAQSLGILLAGQLAQTVFEPLMAEGGAFAGTLGQLIGTGPGRGMALMYIVLGVMLIGLALGSFLARQIRLLEDQVPDYVAPAAAD